MTDFNIDPQKGPHAAAELSDEELTYLANLVAWEVAVRTTSEGFARRLGELIEARDGLDATLEDVRRERELLRFAAEVLADIEALPVVQAEESYGFYL